MNEATRIAMQQKKANKKKSTHSEGEIKLLQQRVLLAPPDSLPYICPLLPPPPPHPPPPMCLVSARRGYEYLARAALPIMTGFGVCGIAPLPPHRSIQPRVSVLPPCPTGTRSTHGCANQFQGSVSCAVVIEPPPPSPTSFHPSLPFRVEGVFACVAVVHRRSLAVPFLFDFIPSRQA